LLLRQPCPEIERVLAVKARPPHQGQQLGVGVFSPGQQRRGVRPALLRQVVNGFESG